MYIVFHTDPIRLGLPLHLCPAISSFPLLWLSASQSLLHLLPSCLCPTSSPSLASLLSSSPASLGPLPFPSISASTSSSLLLPSISASAALSSSAASSSSTTSSSSAASSTRLPQRCRHPFLLIVDFHRSSSLSSPFPIFRSSALSPPFPILLSLSSATLSSPLFLTAGSSSPLDLPRRQPPAWIKCYLCFGEHACKWIDCNV